jgi:NADH-quinone oxidoreductase subunit E
MENVLPLEMDVDPEAVVRILNKHNHARGSLIAVLEEIQKEYGYLPEKALRTVSEKTEQSLVDLYGVATFYRSFSLRPRGEHVISVCLGTACHVRGAPTVVQEFERQLGVRAGETTSDGRFTLETVNCLGACALGPIVVVNGRYFSKVDLPKVKDILMEVRSGGLPAETPVGAGAEG